MPDRPIDGPITEEMRRDISQVMLRYLVAGPDLLAACKKARTLLADSLDGEKTDEESELGEAAAATR